MPLRCSAAPGNFDGCLIRPDFSKLTPWIKSALLGAEMSRCWPGFSITHGVPVPPFQPLTKRGLPSWHFEQSRFSLGFLQLCVPGRCYAAPEKFDGCLICPGSSELTPRIKSALLETEMRKCWSGFPLSMGAGGPFPTINKKTFLVPGLPSWNHRTI